jgi:hypothetical protein
MAINAPLPPTAQPIFTGPGGPVSGPGFMPEPGSYSAPMTTPGTPAVTIPAVQAVEAVTLSPFVRGAMVGLLAGAGTVGVLWWLQRSK